MYLYTPNPTFDKLIAQLYGQKLIIILPNFVFKLLM